MPSNARKKSSPYESAPTHWRQIPSTVESQSHPPKQQQQVQPEHPWSVLRPTYCSKDVPLSTSRSPFLRFGHTLSITTAGELLFFGGYAHDSLHNDLYAFSMRDRSVTLLQTSGDVPSPRILPTGVLVSDVLLILGGATKFDNRHLPTGPYDNSLYLLSLGTLNFLMSRPTLAD
jgi:Galactose oxidase, central domain